MMNRQDIEAQLQDLQHKQFILDCKDDWDEIDELQSLRLSQQIVYCFNQLNEGYA